MIVVLYVREHGQVVPPSLDMFSLLLQRISALTLGL